MIDGKALAAKVREEVAAEVEELGEVGLTTVLVGDDPASHVYITGKQKAATAVGIHAQRPPAPGRHARGRAARAARRAERRRRRRRDPRPAAAPVPPRRGEGDRGDRPREGHRRAPPDERRPPLPRPAAARAGHAARDHAHARRVRDRDEGRARRRDRPLGDRRQADGAPAAPGARDRDHLPLAHGRPASGTRSTPTSSSPPSGSCTSSAPTWCKAGATVIDVGHEPDRGRALRRRRPERGRARRPT